MEGRIRYFEYLEKEERCPVPPVPVKEQDYHNTELASVFAHLTDQPEIRNWLEDIEVKWTYEQLHMVSWFSAQLSLGSGKYSRSRPNHSAKTTYERLLNPFSLLWIAAVLGENPDVVRQARYEMDAYTTWRAKCGVVRRAIPWSRIHELAAPLVEKERNAACLIQCNDEPRNPFNDCESGSKWPQRVSSLKGTCMHRKSASEEALM